jgi:hypothetical protein
MVDERTHFTVAMMVKIMTRFEKWAVNDLLTRGMILLLLGFGRAIAQEKRNLMPTAKDLSKVAFATRASY